MPKLKKADVPPSQIALQAALDAADVIGRWEWDIVADRVYADALVALLFSVDPDQAEIGTPLAAFAAGVHAEDRERITNLIGQCALEGSSYVAEYRVCSADGVTRWVLARGRFHRDGQGRPARGEGIVVDVSASRLSENAFVSSQTAPSENLLERAADQAMAIRETIDALEEPQLQLLADMLLLEVGKRLAGQEMKERRRRMN